MKKIILFSTLICLFASCSKTIQVPLQQSVAGTWVVADASANDGYGWQYIRTGLENGVFDFYQSGAATYDDGYHLMRGSWGIHTEISGYYDQYGTYRHQQHQVWEVTAYDSYTGGSLDMHFDDVVVYGNTIVATYDDGRTIYRYTFRRV